MFTGIVTDLGKVIDVEKTGDTLFKFSTSYETKDMPIGASIACSGVCLTVIDRGVENVDGETTNWFSVQASDETLSKTTLGGWKSGSKVNFERALCVGDELGGHIVSGHVDGVAEVVSIIPENESKRYVFKVPENLSKYIASKGSVAIDGVSLTVNEVEGLTFGINIIPHTQDVTLFGSYKIGDKVNMEIDMLARYIARMLEVKN
ncbi:MAG: riboflavin synthase [Alphaproteobacteria bacterium]|nr:riboflavin synthase [Alphaproteobacteria bacterium]